MYTYILATIFITFFVCLIKKLLYKLFEWINGNNKKLNDLCFAFIKYTIHTCLCFYLLIKYDWLPWFFYGKNDIVSLQKVTFFQKIPDDVLAYMLLCMAMCIENLLTLIKKFNLIYVIHHVCEFVAVLFILYTNGHAIGLSYLLLHYVTDVCLMFTRILHEIKVRKCIWIFNVLTLLSFLYYRLFVLPICTYNIYEIYMAMRDDYNYAGYSGFFTAMTSYGTLLTILCILHVNWFFMMIAILRKK